MAFFAPSAVEMVRLLQCKMPSISSRLFSPFCSSMQGARIKQSTVSDKEIRDRAFENCTGLESLGFTSSGIKQVSSRAFVGLVKLKELHLDGNALGSFEGFEGLDRLERLDLSENQIHFVAEDAFKGLPSLIRVELSSNRLTTLPERLYDPFFINGLWVRVDIDGNPLNCNCSLQWLQDWYETYAEELMYIGEPNCVDPEYAPIRSIKFCEKRSPKPTSKPKLRHKQSVIRQLVLPSCSVQCKPERDMTTEAKITCGLILTDEDLKCLSSILAAFVSFHQDAKLFLILQDTNLDILPDNFLEPYTVSEVHLTNCSMSAIPYRILNPICGSLKSLVMSNCKLEDKTIPARAFQKCSRLRFLFITHSGIQDVSTEAFVGLPKLNALWLQNNSIESFHGFRGIGNLEQLQLSNNRISVVGRNAFWGFRRLDILKLSDNSLTTLPDGVFDPLVEHKDQTPSVHLEGNPFHCDCSLKWLQKWLEVHASNPIVRVQEPSCQGPSPFQGLLRTLPFCNKTMPVRQDVSQSETYRMTLLLNIQKELLNIWAGLIKAIGKLR